MLALNGFQQGLLIMLGDGILLLGAFAVAASVVLGVLHVVVSATRANV